jgi:hypothetical protein
VPAFLTGPVRSGRGFESSRTAMLLGLQQTIGNRAVQRLVQQARQTRAEAAPLPEEDEEQKGDLAARIARAGSGRPLDTDVQRQLETGLGADLSGVRVHTDDEADHLARSVDAVAFTTGQDVFFREGTYNPNSSDGMRLLAHEATHTVQQATGPVAGIAGPGGVAMSDPADRFERAAEEAASTAASVASTETSAAVAARTAQGGRERLASNRSQEVAATIQRQGKQAPPVDDSNQDVGKATAGEAGTKAQADALLLVELQAGRAAWARAGMAPNPPKEPGALAIALGSLPPVPLAVPAEPGPPEYFPDETVPREEGEGGGPTAPRPKARSSGTLLPAAAARAALVAQRSIAWSSYSQMVVELVTAWNLASGPISLFNNAAEDTSLKGLGSEQWKVPKGSTATLPELAGGQPAAGKTNVEEIFRPKSGEPGSDKGVDAGIERARDAAQQAPVGKRNELKDALAELENEVHGMNAKSAARGGVAERALAKLNSFRSASARVRLSDEEVKKEGSEQIKSSLEDQLRLLSSQIQTIGTVFEFIVAAGAQKATGGGAGVAENAIHDLMQKGIEAAAEKVADAQYGPQIERQRVLIEQACQRIRGLKAEIVTADLDAAEHELNEAATDVKRVHEEYLGQRALVKRAYSTVAQLAGQATGADPEVQERVQAMIAAIPIVELVVERVGNALKVIHVPDASPDALRGLGMADRGGDPSVGTFLQHGGWLAAYRADMTQAQVLWAGRLDHLKGMLNQIAGG